MDVALIEAEIAQRFKLGPSAHWEWVNPAQLRLWWQEGYAEVHDRGQDWLLRFNVCDRSPPGAPANRFHRAGGMKKRERKRRFDDAYMARHLCDALKYLVEHRDKYRFLEDPVFGLLKCDRDEDSDVYWDGFVELDFFGSREAMVWVVGPAEGPTPAQRQWFQQFLLRQAELEPVLQERILAEYRAFDEAVDCGLNIRSVADLAEHVSFGTIKLELPWDSEIGNFAVKAKLGFSVSWDDEHGVDALLHDFEIKEVGAL